MLFEQRIGESLAQIGDDPLSAVRGELGHIDVEPVCKSHDDGGRERTLVVFDLVEITRRDSEPFGEGSAGSAPAPAADFASSRRHRVSGLASRCSQLRNLQYPRLQHFRNTACPVLSLRSRNAALRPPGRKGGDSMGNDRIQRRCTRETETAQTSFR